MGILGRLVVHAVFSTSKGDIIGLEKAAPTLRNRKFIAGIWHSRILIFSYLYEGWGAAILVSKSDDGEIIARILEEAGMEPVRGSSSKGGLRALASLIRHVKSGQPGVIIPDGPRGPRFEVKGGIITLAKKTGRPILPMTYSAKRVKIFKSWDRFMLPFPFTRCRVICGEPVWVSRNADRAEEEACRVRLEQELRRITAKADRYFGHHIS